MTEPTKNTSVLITGVGGQGILLAGELLLRVAANAGLDVKKSEIHGMAQRGGAVNAHVRFGERVYSPVIEQGTADVILSFEVVEPLRWAHMAHEKTVCLVNDQRIQSLTTATGMQTYPANVAEELSRLFGDRLHLVDAKKHAEDLGNVRTVNVILLGMLSKFMPFEEAAWQKAMEQRIPAKLLEINQKAFALGRSMVA